MTLVAVPTFFQRARAGDTLPAGASLGRPAWSPAAPAPGSAAAEPPRGSHPCPGCCSRKSTSAFVCGTTDIMPTRTTTTPTTNMVAPLGVIC